MRSYFSLNTMEGGREMTSGGMGEVAVLYFKNYFCCLGS